MNNGGSLKTDFMDSGGWVGGIHAWNIGLGKTRNYTCTDLTLRNKMELYT